MTTSSSAPFHKDATKVAKKALKKADGAMKMKKLTKKILKKILATHPSTDESTISSWISSNYHVKDKLVTSPKVSSDDAPVAKAAVSIDPSDIGAWRKEFKVNLKATMDDEEGQKRTKEVIADKRYDPFTTFADCKSHMPASLLNQCTQVNGFTTPSPIQAQCWPVLIKGGDVVGIAETGSGKTLAFAMPALVHLAKQTEVNAKRRKPRMLVVAPTRELAMQSHAVLDEFGKVVGLNSLTIYGGVPKHTQVSALKRGNVDLVVATPGRLKDLLNEGSIDLSYVSHLVLDEADRMLDEGFRDEIMEIISMCQSHEEGRQTAMFSATWPFAIQKLALEFMRSPLRVYVGFEAIVGSGGDLMDDALSANKRVTQVVEVIEDRARDPRLRQLLQTYHKKRDNRILIFALYKKECERLEYQLQRDGWKCGSIHGNKNQEGRTRALAAFKDGSCPLLIATDVAARGLDIPNVEYVINFTFPLTIEDYVHRIGRTGRAGKTGVAHTLFQPTDKSHAGELQQVMRQANQEVPEDLMAFGSTIKKKEHKLYGAFGPKGGPMKKATKITFD